MGDKDKKEKVVVEAYLNPKAKFMCNNCYDKDKCEQLPEDITFCKLNLINANLSKIIKILEQKNG